MRHPQDKPPGAYDASAPAFFARRISQVQALGRPGDVLVAISTSGHSPNILRAARAARAAGLVTIALAGRDGGELARICDDAVVVPHAATARVQEAHIFIGHTWCGLIEEHLGLAG